MKNNQVIQWVPFSIAKWQEIERQGGKVVHAGCLWIGYVMPEVV
jgi:hypothetical protein